MSDDVDGLVNDDRVLDRTIRVEVLNSTANALD